MSIAPCVSHPAWAKGLVGAHSSVSTGRETGRMKANPWHLLRIRFTPDTMLVLPIFHWPKNVRWPSPVLLVLRNRIWFQCKKLWNNMENVRVKWNQVSKRKCNSSHQVFLKLRNLWFIISDALCLSNLIQGDRRMYPWIPSQIYVFIHIFINYLQ